MSDSTPTVAEQAAMADFVIRTVVGDASGHSDGDRCVGEPPSARYFLASLAPADLDLSTGRVRRGRHAPRSAGFEFNVDDASAAFAVNACISVYHRVMPTFEEQLAYLGGVDALGDGTGSHRLVRVFARREIEVADLVVELDPDRTQVSIGEEEFAEGFRTVADAVAADPTVFRRQDGRRDLDEVPAAALTSVEDYERWCSELSGTPLVPSWAACISVSSRPVEGGERRVTMLLENRSHNPTVAVTRRGEAATRHDDSRDHFLFRVGLELKPRRGAIVPITMNLGPDAYRYDGDLPAYATNCGVEADYAPAGAITALRTLAAPVHETYRTPTRDHSSTRFELLANEPLDALDELASSLRDYLEDPAWDTEGMSDLAHVERKRADCEQFELEIARFEDGVNWLRKDPRLLLAFRLANRSMLHLNRQAGGYRAWRLFQLVFIVSQLSALAWREFDPEEFTPGLWGGPEDRDPTAAASVLWFPTAGGKTEATLGLVACGLFYDRCRGKTRGVTAWSRFPLRLLSLQQTQRYLNFIVAADATRANAAKEIADIGGEAGEDFSVGFYVGNANTPNSITRDDATLQRFISDPERRREVRIVDECPYCNERAVEVLAPDPVVARLTHGCTACGRELPLYIVDTDVYRYLPSVILGTIDKLAMIGLSDRFGALLGDVDCECELHGFGRGEKCHERRLRNHPSNSVRPLAEPLYDPSPSLEILDELHMVREELGTFAGHYEGILAVTQEQLSAAQRLDHRPVRMKVIATTATIKGEDRQCEHLFGLRSVVVPLPGPSLEGSFYWQRDEGAPLRRFVGILPHRATAEMSLIRILQSFHKGVRRLEHDGPAAIPELGSIEPDRFEVLLDLYRVSLTYLTSLVDFGKLRRSMETQVNEHLRNLGLREVGVRELSGDSGFDDVRATLDDLEESGGTEAVLATSMISHGVDVARLNVMAFNGMPKSMAEYIQASSRVGRRFLGIVFMIFNPVRERDRSHFRYHGKFHEYLDRMVEPVAINRWSRYAAQRTLPGVFMAEVLQTANRDYWQNGGAPRHLHDLTRMQQALRPPENGGLDSVQADQLLAALERAYLVDRDGAEELRAELAVRVETAISSIKAAGAAAGAASGRRSTYRGTGDYLGLEYEPMSSLRDVSEGLPFFVLPERKRS